MHVFAFESGLMTVAFLGLAAVKLWAMVDAASRSKQAYVAAEKLTKAGWLWILGLTLVVHMLFGPLHLLSIAGTVAAFVYLLDVRPALSSLTRR